MNKGTVLALLVVVLGGGYGIGRLVVKDKGGAGASAKTPSAAAKEIAGASDGVDRVRVPLEGAAKGPADAKVNIVTFSDFQCPFCSRVVPTLAQIEKEYGKKVRVFFRHNPLPFHADAPLASEATIAAEQQGKFWEMHDKLFANQQNLKRPDLEKYAQELGLDMGKFKAALDSGAGKARIQADMALAKQVGANGTPNFFINGRNLVGAQPFEKFKEIIDDDLARADKLIAKGTPPGQVYAAFMKGAKASPTAAAARQAAAAAEGPGRQHRGLQGRGRRRADQGRQAAQGHDHRVLRVPVPVLQPRQPHARDSWSRTTATTSRSRSGTTRCRSTTTR